MPGRIDGVPPPEGSQRIRQSDSHRAEAKSTDRAPSTRDSDRVELSATARETQQIESRLQNAVRDAPDVREDRVARARARIEAGEYDNENVRRIIADRILSQLGIE